MKKILISTGGSGGHVIPAITLYEHYKDKFDIFLTTDERGTNFINKEKYFYEIINTPKFYSNIFKFPLTIIFLLNSFFKSLIYLKKNKINFLFSTGGYMSSPLCFAAIILNIDIFLFEPNMVLGRSNRLFLNFSKKIICYSDKIKNFPDKDRKKMFLIEHLLRKEVYTLKKNSKLNISNPIKLLILGGSQGAKFFDEKIEELIIKLSKFHEIHLTQQLSHTSKKEKFEETYKKINLKSELFNFKYNLHERLNDIDFAITRSGASALSELSFYNIPFIAVPFPYAQDNHQYYNAKYYLDKNCCWLIKQNEFDVEKVKDLILNIFGNNEDYLIKKKSLNKFSYQNTWNNINQKLLKLINGN